MEYRVVYTLHSEETEEMFKDPKSLLKAKKWLDGGEGGQFWIPSYFP